MGSFGRSWSSRLELLKFFFKISRALFGRRCSGSTPQRTQGVWRTGSGIRDRSCRIYYLFWWPQPEPVVEMLIICFAITWAVRPEPKPVIKIILRLRGLFALAGAGSGSTPQLTLFSYGSTDSGSGSSFAVVLEGVGFVTVQCAVFSVCSQCNITFDP
jgi:hypothetical protein